MLNEKSLKTRNVFFVHTPFQLYISEKIGANLPSPEKRILISEIIGKKLDYSEKIWDKVIEINSTQDRRFGYVRWKKFHKCTRLIDHLFLNRRNDSIYVSDISWPLNNYIFTKYKVSQNISIFQDGIGSYSNIIIRDSDFLKASVKLFLSKFALCVPHWPYRGNAMGQDQEEIRRVYGFDLKNLKCPEGKKVRISVSFESDKQNRRLIFLDQPYWRLVNKVEWIELKKQTREFIINNFGDNYEFYYKPHHRGSKSDTEEYRKHGFTLVDTDECIEKYIEKNFFSVVISYNSSALFNLKLVLKDNLRAISLISSSYIKNTKYMSEESTLSIFSLFEELGVENIHLDNED